MSKSRRKKSTRPKPGLPPGALVRVGEEKTGGVKITLMSYNAEVLLEKEVETIPECLSFVDEQRIAWINIEGVHQLDTIRRAGEDFDLHPLTLEDIVNTEHRPKMESYDDYLFVILKMFRYNEAEHRLEVEQVSLVIKPGLLLSFQEQNGEVFDPVRDRLRAANGRMRKEGSDYLAYALMDAIVDHYFVVLEQLGERIDFLEEELISAPERTTLHEIHELKREMITLRRSVWPLRELINSMIRCESGLIRESTLLFLRDLYDHIIQIIDTIETHRDMLSGMVDIYLSSLSNKMNEIMKVLTIIATIFIPLTFIAGVYGMNFKYMPELDWSWGYPAVLLLMTAAGVTMLVYFRKKRWI